MTGLVVVDYDPAWTRWFESLRSTIWSAVADVATSIEHVGSTAVPGLAAKPVIDIDVVVPARHLPDAITRLATLGYRHEGDRGIPQRESFRRPPDSLPHHLYVCPFGSPALANHIAVRDYLRDRPEAALAYGEMKKRLALQYSDDPASYVEGKTTFLVGILRETGFCDPVLAEIERMNRRP
jgi:GrpB-like predicted nucleotidyltransferase (UPF0157 family)